MKSINILMLVSAFVCFLSCSPLHKEAEQENQSRVISNVNKNAESVYLTQNHLGEAAIVWTEKDTSGNEEKHCFFSLWDSLSYDFGKKIEIPIEQNAALHTEGMPKLAFKKSGEIIAIYEVKVKSEFNPYAGEIHYIVSTDNGKSWSSPEMVHASKFPNKSRSFFDMTILNDGEVGVCWLGESSGSGGRPVVFARTNKENKFVNEIIVDSSACQCCRTAIYADKEGMISIVYRDIINDSIRDISVTVSKDNGKSFTEPLCFSGDNWNINGCPHNGPDVVNDKNNIYAVWFTGASERGVYFGKLDKQNLKVEKKRITENGRYIQLVNRKDGPVIVYNDTYTEGGKNYSKIMIKTLSDTVGVPLTNENNQEHSPVIISHGKEGLVVAWLGNEGKIDVVKYKNIKNDM